MKYRNKITSFFLILTFAFRLILELETCLEFH
jgi:hypothetical protein